MEVEAPVEEATVEEEAADDFLRTALFVSSFQPSFVSSIVETEKISLP